MRSVHCTSQRNVASDAGPRDSSRDAARDASRDDRTGSVGPRVDGRHDALEVGAAGRRAREEHPGGEARCNTAIRVKTSQGRNTPLHGCQHITGAKHTATRVNTSQGRNTPQHGGQHTTGTKHTTTQHGSTHHRDETHRNTCVREFSRARCFKP